MRAEAELLGWLASALVLCTFLMSSMVALRVAAIASNIAFIVYASMTGLEPILILHAVLLPTNLLRLAQALEARREGAR